MVPYYPPMTPRDIARPVVLGEEGLHVPAEATMSNPTGLKFTTGGYDILGPPISPRVRPAHPLYGAVYDTVSADVLAESAAEAELNARYNAAEAQRQAAVDDLNQFQYRKDLVGALVLCVWAQNAYSSCLPAAEPRSLPLP